jgi:hypothetical protein
MIRSVLALAGLCGLLAGCGLGGAGQHPVAAKMSSSTTLPSLPCPSSPLRGVYDPSRLHVLGTCRWYVGVVTRVEHEHDGDYHVDVRPANAAYRRFLDATNLTQLQGSLVTEIMPGQRLHIPTVGEPVAVFGTWVFDANHGWNEIHPIWAINYRDTHHLVEYLPPRTPLHDPTGPTAIDRFAGGLVNRRPIAPGQAPSRAGLDGSRVVCAGGRVCGVPWWA